MVRWPFISGVLLMGLLSCNIAESIVFEHGPSDRFFLTNNFDAKELDSSRVGSYLFLSALKKSTHTEHKLWISICSKEKIGRARLLSASLTSNGQKLVLPIEVSGVDSDSLPPKSSRTGLACKNWDVLTIEQAQLDSLSSGGADIRLVIDIASDTADNYQIRYDFKVKRERRSVFPT